jgi:RING finger protein 113A
VLELRIYIMFKKKKRKNAGGNAMTSALDESSAKSSARSKGITFSASSSSSSSGASSSSTFSSSSTKGSADALLHHSFASDASTTLVQGSAAGDVSNTSALEAQTANSGGSSGSSSNPAKKRKLGGPTRPGGHVRANVTFDFKPDICKDYKETGFCSFGDTCKFIHDRGDFKSGAQQDKEWQEQKRQALNAKLGIVSKKRGAGSSSDGDARKKESASSALVVDIPFKCLKCRNDFEDPIITLCKHYFCESCALQHYRTSKRCFVCNQDTQGVFNSAKAVIEESLATRKGAVGASGEQAQAEKSLADAETDKEEESDDDW